MPAGLSSAFEAAGGGEREELERGHVDSPIGMRAACVLPRLVLTLHDVHRLPLLTAQRHEID
jgi:hypothetical protein